MTCEELRERYALYAVGALPPEEQGPLEEHLARGCPTCTAGVAAFQERRPAALPAGRPAARPASPSAEPLDRELLALALGLLRPLAYTGKATAAIPV